MGFDAAVAKAMEDQCRWDDLIERYDPRRVLSNTGNSYLYSVGDARHEISFNLYDRMFFCRDCNGRYDAPNIWTHLVQNGPIHNGSRHSPSGLGEAAEMARLTSMMIASFGVPPADVIGEAEDIEPSGHKLQRDYDGCLICDTHRHEPPVQQPDSVDQTKCPGCKQAKFPDNELCFYCEQLAKIKLRNDRAIGIYNRAVRAAAEMERREQFVRYRWWRMAIGAVMLVSSQIAGIWPLWVLALFVIAGPPWYKPRPIR